MKILFLPKYSSSGASSRYRTHQFIPFFRDEGIRCDVESFFDDNHISNINRSRRRLCLDFLLRIAKRFFLIFKARRYDLFFIEKELVPYFPGFIESVLKLSGVKIILDYDDAIFHNYDSSSNPVVRFFLRKKICRIMKKADCIIAGSRYIENYALKFNISVTRIPTVINLQRYPEGQYDRDGEFIIGWIGSFYTTPYVNLIADVLQCFVTEHDRCSIHLIGYNTRLLPEGIKRFVKVIEWDEKTEVEEIKRFSVGISPLQDTPFSRGKCAFKSIQYMACSLPVIVTPIGANAEIIRHEENGFHAETGEDWYRFLDLLYNNRDEAARIGRRNREVVEDKYCVQSRLNDYLEVFEDVLKDRDAKEKGKKQPHHEGK